MKTILSSMWNESSGSVRGVIEAKGKASKDNKKTLRVENEVLLKRDDSGLLVSRVPETSNQNNKVDNYPKTLKNFSQRRETPSRVERVLKGWRNSISLREQAVGTKLEGQFVWWKSRITWLRSNQVENLVQGSIRRDVRKPAKIEIIWKWRSRMRQKY